MYLKPKEELQLQLFGVHNSTKHTEEKYMAEIRANVQMKWNATANMIIEAQAKAAKKN